MWWLQLGKQDCVDILSAAGQGTNCRRLFLWRLLVLPATHAFELAVARPNRCPCGLECTAGRNIHWAVESTISG